MTCHDICHMSRDALTFAWADVTWHGRHVTMTHDGTGVRARAKLGSQVMIGVSWHTIWGVSWILYILGIQLDKYSQSNPIFTTFLFNYISTHSHTQLKGLSTIMRCWSKMLSSSTSMIMIMSMIMMIRRVLPWSSSSSSGESPPREKNIRPSYPEIFQTHVNAIFSGRHRNIWWLHHLLIVIILVTTPFIYIGFRLDHSLMLCICFCFCKAPYLKKMDVFDLPLQIILWFQFGIVGLFFDIT